MQANLGLIDRDFDLALQPAQVATRQIEDADIRAHMRDPMQATKAVGLARPTLHSHSRQHMPRSSSYNSSTKSLQRKLALYTTTFAPQVQPTHRSAKRWLPCSTIGTSIQRSTARRTIPTTGIRPQPLRARQQCITTRRSTNCNGRATATSSTP